MLLCAAVFGLPAHNASAQDSRGVIAVDKAAPGDTPETAPSPQLVSGKYRALIIGNNEYRGKKWPPLKTAAKDATELVQVLRDQYGFAKEDITLRTNATRRETLKAFSQLSEASQPEDSVLVYYAGHGEYDELERGWWVPVDAEDRADYISSDDILGAIRSIKANHKLLIADSCFSGNMLTRGAREAPQAVVATRYVIEKTRLHSVQGMSSGGNEPVSDGGAQWEGHSIFAYHLLSQLRANTRRYFSAQLLGFNMAERVANDTASIFGKGQTPVFSPIKNQGDQGGDFFFSNQQAVTARVAMFFARGDAAAPAPNHPDVRSPIAGALTQDMRALGLEPVNGAADLDPSNESVALAEGLHALKVDRAIVLRVNGEMQREHTLMWEGHSTINVSIDAFRLEGDRIVRVGTQQLDPQRLPMRSWDVEPAAVQAQYRKTAEKLVQRAAHAKIQDFLEHLRD